MGEAFADRPATLAEYLGVLRRRKWIVLALPLLAAFTAYSLSARETPVYKANAEVLFQLYNIPQQLAGLPSYISDPNYMTTQANIATSPQLVQKVLDTSGPGQAAGASLSASAPDKTNILGLSVTSPDQAAAAPLVNAYASEFLRYRAELYMRPINTQLIRYKRQLASMRARHQTETPTYQTLLEKRFDLESFGRQLASNASVLRKAEGAAQISPRPRRNGILGAILGLILGVGVAFLAEALDKRVRSEEQIQEALGIPLLGRVPPPTRRLRKGKRLVMLADPANVHAQTFRRLRTSLEFVNFERRARTIMVTSALPREGKSTTVANLAVALARAGRRVALADLDLRRPVLHTFFDTGMDHGFTDVVAHRLTLRDALRSIALPATGRLPTPASNGMSPTSNASSNGQGPVDCVLAVLPSGTVPPAADEFLESAGIAPTLQELRGEFDLVLVDTPPLLAVGDVMALSTKMDAIVVVTRLGIHRRQLEELARQLGACRAPVLGFILTGAAHGDSYSYGYGYDPRGYEVPQAAQTTGERI